jgi:hypothetical protein
MFLTVSLVAAQTAAAQLLPVGDGHVSDGPVVGNVYSCRSTFRSGGSRHEGPWFHGDSWDPTAKPHVSGHELWPEAAFAMTQDGAGVDVRSNGLPVDEPTGVFPISPGDSVYRYDTNPNPIATLALSFEIPATPRRADQPGCLPMGMVGFTTTGVAIS